MIGVKSVLDAWWKLSGIFAGGMLGLFLLGILSRRAKDPAAATATVLGVLVILWMTFSPGWTGAAAALASPLHKFLIPVVVSLCFGVFIAFFVTLLLVPALYAVGVDISSLAGRTRDRVRRLFGRGPRSGGDASSDDKPVAHSH